MISAVLQTSFLGDMVLTTPLIARLAEAGPVHVVATPANASLLANNPAVASVIVFDKRGRDSGWRGLQRVARQLRHTRAQYAYMAQGSVRTAMLARLAGIQQRVGFASSAGRWLYTTQVPYQHTWHHAERLWQLASRGEATGEVSPDRMSPSVRPLLYPGKREHDAVDALLAEYEVQPHERLIALAPGSVWATKRWPGYVELAAQLSAHENFSGSRLVVIGGVDDAPIAQDIVDVVARGGASGARPRPVVNATGQLSLLASAALLSRVAVLVTNDSAPLHLASAMNTPTIALFGPTVPEMGFGPLAERRHIIEVTNLTCRPCGPHGAQQCPLGHWRCMRDIPVDRVARAVLATFDSL